jgi:hypothetical protein
MFFPDGWCTNPCSSTSGIIESRPLSIPWDSFDGFNSCISAAMTQQRCLRLFPNAEQSGHEMHDSKTLPWPIAGCTAYCAISFLPTLNSTYDTSDAGANKLKSKLGFSDNFHMYGRHGPYYTMILGLHAVVSTGVERVYPSRPVPARKFKKLIRNGDG